MERGICAQGRLRLTCAFALIRPKKKFLFPITRPCVPKKNLLKLFFFNFTIDKIPNLPRSDSDHFTDTMHVYKCKNRDGNDVIRSLLLSSHFKNILQKTAYALKRLRFVSKMLCKNGVCKTLYGSLKKLCKKKSFPTYLPKIFWTFNRKQDISFFWPKCRLQYKLGGN